MPHKDPILDKQWHRDYYLKNKERLNELNKQAHKENLIERKAKQKEYRGKTKETKAEYNKTYWNEKKTILLPKAKIRYKTKQYRYPKYQRAWELRNQQKRYEKELNLYLKYGKFFNLNPYKYKSLLIAWAKLVRYGAYNSCLQCGNKAKVSHHLIYKKTMPKLSLNLSNGIALCSPCHKEIHKLNGY